MTTLAGFRTAVTAKLGLDNTASSFDQGLIDGWVNDGVTHICARIRPHIISETFTLTAGKYDYSFKTDLSVNVLAINECFITDFSSSVWYKLNRQTPQQILDLRVGTQFQGSPPVRWYAVNGFDTLMVYPTPIAADVFTIYYQPVPAVLAATGDTPSDIPAEYHKAVEYYALSEAGAYINDAPSQNGALFHQMYLAELIELRKSLRQRGGLKLAPAVVGRRRHHIGSIGQPSQQDV